LIGGKEVELESLDLERVSGAVKGDGEVTWL
jgi:hypothetical protein